MALQLTGKSARVTGASTPGIGRAITAELAREGVTVAIAARHGELLRRVAQEINSIQPGRIKSEQMTRQHPTEESRREFSQWEIPVGRFGELGELADLAVFLASPRAGHITGTVIPVDGGMKRFAF